jgi:hypothetical protein
MRTECETFAALQKTTDRTLAQRARRLAFVHSMIRGLSARAVTNEKRLANEQNLVRLSILRVLALAAECLRANDHGDVVVEYDRPGEQ